MVSQDISGLLTLGEVAAEVCSNFGDSSQPSLNKAYNKINRAIRTVARKGRWPFFNIEDTTITTATNMEDYNLPERIRLPEFLHLREPATKLRLIDLRTLRRLYPNNTEMTGTPRFWRIVSFDENAQRYNIALWPIPDGAYTIYIDADQTPRMLQDVDDDLRSTGLPEEMIETVISIATAFMYENSADNLFTTKIQLAMAMLDDDYYRLGSHPDDNMNAREYGSPRDYRDMDPVLPINYCD